MGDFGAQKWGSSAQGSGKLSEGGDFKAEVLNSSSDNDIQHTLTILVILLHNKSSQNLVALQFGDSLIGLRVPHEVAAGCQGGLQSSEGLTEARK